MTFDEAIQELKMIKENKDVIELAEDYANLIDILSEEVVRLGGLHSQNCSLLTLSHVTDIPLTRLEKIFNMEVVPDLLEYLKIAKALDYKVRAVPDVLRCSQK